MQRDWTLARAKVDAEGVCRYCGRRCGRLEAAHTIGRQHDQDAVVDPEDIVPLGGPATTSSTCHAKHHAHKLNLLSVMTVEEQVAAVRAAGGIAQAFRRLTPVLTEGRTAQPALPPRRAQVGGVRFERR